jgi:hypothetical protein
MATQASKRKKAAAWRRHPFRKKSSQRKLEEIFKIEVRDTEANQGKHYWTFSDSASGICSQAKKILKETIKNMPMYIGHPDPHIRAVAKTRLLINR